MNYPYYLEFLYWMLKKTGKNDKASLLQRNLFVVLGSIEMIALDFLLSIIHISVCMPFRWLAGKTHRLKEYKNWGPLSMAQVIDTHREKMNAISEKPELILNEQFMIDIFKEYCEELPLFQVYWDEVFNKKQMSVVARRLGSKVVQLADIKKSLFKPYRKTDKQANKRLLLL